MTATPTIIEPNFVLLTFDIPAKNGSDRTYVLRKLRAHGFVMWTQSVYYGLYSHNLVKDVKEFCRAKPDITLTLTTPSFPNDQATMLEHQYDNNFVLQWTELTERLQEIEKMMAGEILYKPKKGKEIEYTPEQIEERLKYADHIIGDLEHALAKRAQNEPKRAKQFEQLSQQLRVLDNWGTTLKATNKRRIK